MKHNLSELSINELIKEFAENEELARYKKNLKKEIMSRIQ